MKKFLALLGLLGILALATSAHASTFLAVVDPDLAEGVTDATTLFTSVKTYIIAVVVFMIGVGILKMVRRGK